MNWEFDTIPLNSSSYGARVISSAEIPVIYKQLADKFSNIELASLADVAKAHRKNRHTVYVIEKDGIVYTIFAFLMLNGFGLEQLLLGQLNTKTINPRVLSEEDEKPAAIYLWNTLSVKPGAIYQASQCIKDALSSPQFRSANIFSRPINDHSISLNKKLGFMPFLPSDPSLRRYTRLVNQRETLTAAA